MKHNFIKRGLFVAVAAAGLLAGCQKEEGPVTLGIETEGVGGARSGAKVIIDDNYTPVWEGGESVLINGETKAVVLENGQAQLQGLAEAENYRAFYPASMVSGTNTDISSSASVSMTLPSNQAYNINSNGKQQVVLPMGAYMDDNSGTLQFKNLCSLVRLTVNNTNASGGATITVTGVELSTSTTDVNLCGTGSATVDGTETAFTVSSNGSRRITLGLGTDGVEIAAGGSHDFYFVVAPFATQSSLTFTVHADGMSDFTKTVNNKTLLRNTLAGASISISGVPAPPLASGLFQVDANGKKVKFALGNLRYTTNAIEHWSFCKHQYDYNSSNIGSNGVWEYFGWSTDGATQYGMSTSETNDDYSGKFKDWGTAVDAQGNLGTGWRTLTKEEWGYIFNTRSGAIIKGTSNCRYLRATVCSKAGVILIPDGCAWPASVSYYNAANFNNETLYYDRNSYNETEWASLEDVGCVFLPAAGSRKGTSVDKNGADGHYWSSASDDELKAYYLNFYNNVLPQSNGNRYFGRSVRLVQDQPQN